MRWMMRRINRGDRGAVALLVTLVTVFVLLGAGAIVLNTGSWYAERAQLQNGADAAALAVAQSCARGACDGAYSAATDLAPKQANGNANDNLSTVDYVCGGTTADGTGAFATVVGFANLRPCSAATAGWTSTGCPAPPDQAGVHFVNVHTSTRTSGGISIPVIGNLDGHPEHIKACAQASWGPPATCTNCTAFTISECEWEANTANGTEFATAWTSDNPVYPPSYLDTITARRSDPVFDTTAGDNSTNYYVTNNITDPHSVPRLYTYSDPPPTMTSVARVAGSETVLVGHGFGDVCKSNSGQDAPGQFGWLGKNSNLCTFTLYPDNSFAGSQGSPPADCQSVFETSRTSQTPVYIPVFSSCSSTTTTGNCVLDGWAAFVVTGWAGMHQGNSGFKTDSDEASKVTLADTSINSKYAVYDGTSTGPKDKPSNTQEIYGYFTQALIPTSALPGGTGQQDLGATGFHMTG